MTPGTTLTLYAVACLAVCITPGPTTLLALSNGTKKNWRIAAMGILGACLSDILLIGAVGLGLGALLAASEALFTMVKWCGVAYLVFLGIALWKSTPTALPSQQSISDSAAGAAFLRSLAVALSNPKGLLFFTAFLPQFIDPRQPQAAQYAILAAVSALLDILVMSGYAIGGAQAAKYLSARSMRRLNRSCAVAMLSLAGFLCLYRRADA